VGKVGGRKASGGVPTIPSGTGAKMVGTAQSAPLPTLRKLAPRNDDRGVRLPIAAGNSRGGCNSRDSGALDRHQARPGRRRQGRSHARADRAADNRTDGTRRASTLAYAFPAALLRAAGKNTLGRGRRAE